MTQAKRIKVGRPMRTTDHSVTALKTGNRVT